MTDYDPMDDQDNAYDTWKDKQLDKRAAAGSDEPSDSEREEVTALPA